MKRALGACALILALAVAFISPASAAQLVLTGGQHPSSFASARCGDAVAATNPATASTTNAVQLSGIDVACAGLPVAVQLYDSLTATTVTGSATAPAAGGGVVVTMSGQYTPTASTATGSPRAGPRSCGSWSSPRSSWASPSGASRR